MAVAFYNERRRRELSPKIDDGKRTDPPEIGAFTKDKSKQAAVARLS